MSHGLNKVYASTMASGGTMSGEVNLGRSYQNVYLMIPSMATASNGMSIYASDASGGTFCQVMHPSVNSATVATNAYLITSAATSVIVPVPVGGLRFLKVNTDATVAHGCVFKFICGD